MRSARDASESSGNDPPGDAGKDDSVTRPLSPDPKSVARRGPKWHALAGKQLLGSVVIAHGAGSPPQRGTGDCKRRLIRVGACCQELPGFCESSGVVRVQEQLAWRVEDVVGGVAQYLEEAVAESGEPLLHRPVPRELGDAPQAGQILHIPSWARQFGRAQRAERRVPDGDRSAPVDCRGVNASVSCGSKDNSHSIVFRELLHDRGREPLSLLRAEQGRAGKRPVDFRAHDFLGFSRVHVHGPRKGGHGHEQRSDGDWVYSEPPRSLQASSQRIVLTGLGRLDARWRSTHAHRRSSTGSGDSSALTGPSTRLKPFFSAGSPRCRASRPNCSGNT